MKQWQEDKVSSTQIRSMEYVLLQLLEDGKIDALNSVDDLLVFCAYELSKVKQTYLDNKGKECYDNFSNRVMQEKNKKNIIKDCRNNNLCSECGFNYVLNGKISRQLSKKTDYNIIIKGDEIKYGSDDYAYFLENHCNIVGVCEFYKREE